MGSSMSDALISGLHRIEQLAGALAASANIADIFQSAFMVSHVTHRQFTRDAKPQIADLESHSAIHRNPTKHCCATSSSSRAWYLFRLVLARIMYIDSGVGEAELRRDQEAAMARNPFFDPHSAEARRAERESRGPSAFRQEINWIRLRCHKCGSAFVGIHPRQPSDTSYECLACGHTWKLESNDTNTL
jgi:DNA-directed RNA polymerase subunit RPC12/RpoP